ncbi:cytochrome P450 [Nostoc sp.]|uniref:cytochrome P450 n=1 Tax=Nostoc sp. TaxID=1180 RepID=UPI0035948418
MTHLKLAEELPGHVGLPILGETLDIISTQGWGLAKNYQKYGPVFKTRLSGKNYVVLVGPEASRVVLQEKADHFSSYLGLGPFMEPIFGRPMMLQDGELHRYTRRLMSPAFHSRAIATYFKCMQHEVDRCLSQWLERGIVPLKNEFNQLALRIGIRLLLGVQSEHDIEQIEQWYGTLVQGVFTLLRWDVPFTTFGRSQMARRQLRQLLQDIITERKRQGHLQASQDVLGLFLASVDAEGNALAEAQIIDEMIHLLNGAHFTTATSLTWALVELAALAEWRERLRQELNQVLQNESLNLGHLSHLTQMTNFLKEVERVYNPSGVVLLRGVVKEFDYAGYRIPPGWGVIVAQGLTHRAPDIYTAPDHFDPDRFAPPREEDKKHPFSLIGFGGGEHICIGIEFAKMEMKILLATLLRHYDWSVTPEYQQLRSKKFPFQAERWLQAKLQIRQ